MYEIVVADINSLKIWDFVNEGESPDEVLENARKDNVREVQRWEELCKIYPCDEYDVYLKNAKEAEYKIMAYGEFLKLERDYYLNLPMKEVTREIFDERLDVLPPLKWCTINGIEMFCLREMTTRTYTDQYARDGDKFYCKTVDVADKSTWIHNILLDNTITYGGNENGVF